MMEIMSPDESLWEDSHHWSLFLPNADLVDSYFVYIISSDMVEYPQMPVLLEGFDSEGNLYNITKTIPIDISVKLGCFEHVHIGQNYSAMEIEEYQALFKEFHDVFS